MKQKIKLYSRIFLINKKYKKNELYHYLDLPDVAILIPIINKKFLIVSQKREPINKVNFEFPCGWVDLGEKPEKSATRELLEETGYQSLIKPKKLIKFYEEPGRMNSQAHCFFTKKIIKIKRSEKGIKIFFFTKNQIIDLIKKNKFNNGTHIAAFYKYLSLNIINSSKYSKNWYGNKKVKNNFSISLFFALNKKFIAYKNA